MTAHPTLENASRVLCAALALMGALLGSPATAQEANLANAVKATFLYKFVPFIEWPSDRFISETDPVNICISGNDPFGDILDEAVAGQVYGSHPIMVHRLGDGPGEARCHVLYASGIVTPDILASVHGQPVLTVTDSANDNAAEGIVHFVIADNRVRFEIDTVAASQNRLTISSRLLALALSVREGGDN